MECKKKLVGDILAGIIIAFGCIIPSLVLKFQPFIYYENKETLYNFQYVLTSLFLFVFVLYVAYFIRNIINKVYF